MLPPAPLSFSINGNSILPLLKSETLKSFFSPIPYPIRQQILLASQNIFRIWPLLFTSTPDSLVWAAFASHLGHAVAPLVVPCFHSFLLYYIFNPVARWSALKSKSNHVLHPLRTQNPSKAFCVTQSESQSPSNGLCGNIWPPAAFLIQSPTLFPLALPAPATSLLSEAPLPLLRCSKHARLKPLHCLFPLPRNALSPDSHMAYLLAHLQVFVQMAFSHWGFLRFLIATPFPLYHLSSLSCFNFLHCAIGILHRAAVQSCAGWMPVWRNSPSPAPGTGLQQPRGVAYP